MMVGGILDTLVKHKAWLHKSCCLKFSNSKLNLIKTSGNTPCSNSETVPLPRAKRLKLDAELCIFCGILMNESSFRKFKSVDTITNTRSMLIKLEDTLTLPRFCDNDLTILDNHGYHAHCMADVHNKYKSVVNKEKVQTQQRIHDKECKDAVLFEIVEYLYDLKRTSEPPPFLLNLQI